MRHTSRRGPISVVRSLPYFQNTAEGGTNGTTVTQSAGGNSGGASGTFFDTVSIGASSALTFDNTHVAHGSLAYLISGGSAVSTFAAKNFSAATAAATMRCYDYLAANPVGLTAIGGFYSGSTVRVRLGISSTGKLTISTPSAGTAVATGSCPLSAYWRWDMTAVLLTGSSGSVTVNRYDSMDSPTPSETISLSGVNLVGTADRVRFGVSTAPAGALPTLSTDCLAWNDTGAAIPAAA